MISIPFAHQCRGEEQLKAFQSNSELHAKTDPKVPAAGHSLLAPVDSIGISEPRSVCGQGCDAPPAPVAAPLGTAVAARIAVLTASDRAARGAYEDKSGPAVVEMVTLFAERNRTLMPTVVEQKVLPDEEEAIFTALKAWSEAKACELAPGLASKGLECLAKVITTGGTGFGPRDVTPEATRRLLVRPAENLSRAMAWQTSWLEPRSILSRGVCGLTAQQVGPHDTP